MTNLEFFVEIFYQWLLEEELISEEELTLEDLMDDINAILNDHVEDALQHVNEELPSPNLKSLDYDTVNK